MPDRLFRNRKSFMATLVVLWAFMFGLGFVGIAEWFFWDEFKARFNFIAVDYLVYTSEVFNNVMESYPIKPILIGIGIVALLGVYLLLPFIRRGVRRRGDRERSRHRHERRCFPLHQAALVIVQHAKSWRNKPAAYSFAASCSPPRLGYGDYFDKPIVGVANTHSPVTPCNKGIAACTEAALKTLTG